MALATVISSASYALQFASSRGSTTEARCTSRACTCALSAAVAGFCVARPAVAKFAIGNGMPPLELN